MLVWTNFILHFVFAVLIIMFGGYEVFDIFLVIISFTFTFLTSHLTLVGASRRRGNAYGVLAIGVIIYFWIAYTAKFGLALYIGESYWVVPELINYQKMLELLPWVYFQSMLGLVAIIVGIATFPLRQTLDWRLTEGSARLKLMLLLLIFALFVKYYLKSEFQLGVPAQDPVQLPVPYLSGVLALLMGFGMQYLANIPFFLALYAGNRWTILITFAAAMANAGIDLRFGSKDTLMFQLALTVIYLSMFWVGLQKDSLKFKKTAIGVIFAIGIIGVLTLQVYKYFNFVRYAYRAGATSLWNAAQVATEFQSVQSRSSLIELFNRLTGIETFAAVMKMYTESNFLATFSDALSGRLMRNFSDTVLAGANTSSAFSMTLLGTWYVYGGIAAIVLVFFATGFIFAMIQTVILRARSVSHNMRLAFLPVYWILCVQLTLGGNPMIWIKTIVVTLPFAFLISRLAFLEPPRRS